MATKTAPGKADLWIRPAGQKAAMRTAEDYYYQCSVIRYGDLVCGTAPFFVCVGEGEDPVLRAIQNDEASRRVIPYEVTATVENPVEFWGDIGGLLLELEPSGAYFYDTSRKSDIRPF